MSFIVYPALDIRGGRVVRLRQGDYAQETHYGDDPLPRAQAFEARQRVGAQFHPERSGDTGALMLRNFLEDTAV